MHPQIFLLTQEYTIIVEGCSFETDEDIYSFSRALPQVANWKGHKIMNGGESLAHLVNGQQIQIETYNKAMKITPTETKAEIGGTISWGGEKGVEISGYASGSASDDNGNTADVTVEVNSDGTGSATVSVSHDKD